MSKKYLFILFTVVFFISCRKDIKPIPKGTTPYTFEYPDMIGKYLPPIDEPNDNVTTEEGVELGRLLFFDKRLSADNTQSCASCHMPEHSFSDTGAVSYGIDGIAGTRNAMPIINVGWMEDGLFWDGRSASVEGQALEPVPNPIEMHQSWPNTLSKLQADPLYPSKFEQIFGSSEIDSIMVVKAIAQFERTLISGNSPFDKFVYSNFATGSSGWALDKEQLAYQGFAIFMDETKGDCFHCHGDQFNPLWTDNIYHNNGLDANPLDPGLAAVTGNSTDHGKFKTPTLRNLLFTGPYMHDGRFTTLSQVVQHYSFGLQNSATIDPLMKSVNDGGVQLDPQEQTALLWFLYSLTDSSFVTNPNFQDPW
ncbi:cytochrome-c peroxidase [Paracrocinitomix mangrovi]|uniref:cytochrome-c peroxidase n=1 Tax=Paracrocinitomix mangrovi TaxID=2862509 RepID=UPI001C8DEA40|nr:cytochrome c peroxidase [Paracrocinitomix mangrovi]UKN00588.1 cytochrome-c peroxidase [Paracrocinitomix mangrovi]